MSLPQGFTAHGATFTLETSANEARILREIMDQVAELAAHGDASVDEAVGRLLPDGYRDDEKAALELRSLTEGSLRSAKVAAAREVASTLPHHAGAVELDEQQAQSWLTALTDARLVLANRIGLTGDSDLIGELDDAVAEDPEGPRTFAISVYHYLSFLQETLVHAVADWDEQ
ncbi:MAG: DUF2017 domain-containing protein [Corynebacteriales bacterium]|nr:DUF2017 domain-containing protein [Mycobacteriales bacterium]